MILVKVVLVQVANKTNARKIIVDGHKFDSEMESRFYAQLVRYKANGEIKDFSLQPKYTVLESFIYQGSVVKGITYTPDFLVTHLDGTFEVVEVKGMVMQDFSLRLKLFKKAYPHLKISVITECPKKYGEGFISLFELKKLRKADKKGKTNETKKAHVQIPGK